ncbi:MAG: hypothetical protein DRI90_18135, partial [Deltaproteobacteria bacterium]
HDSTECMFQIPVPQQGPQNFALVNVVLVDKITPSITKTVFQVTSSSNCHVTNGGWYYDDPNAPQAIVLCPASCSDVSQGASWTMTVELGCPTMT